MEKRALENEKKAKELAAKEKELADADQQAKSVTEELEKREKEVIAKEKAANSRSGTGGDDKSGITGGSGSSKEEADLAKRQKDLEEREKQLQAREKELAQREQHSSQPATAARPNSASNDPSVDPPADVETLKKENASLKVDLERLKAKLANAQIGQQPEKRTIRGNRMSAGPAVGHHIPHVQPGSRLPGGWDPHLLARFEAGRRAMAKSK